ncbi:MAG: hypothetical protein KJ956_00475 [Actinobacteria bacterium]|nr:hypothetical protein [Actinomycetota bacterium]
MRDTVRPTDPDNSATSSETNSPASGTSPKRNASSSRELDAAEARLKAVDVEFGQAEANLAEAPAFAADWHAAYLEAADIVRRQLNQAIFEKIYVDDAQHVRSALAEPFETPLSDEITAAARQRAETIDQEWREVAENWPETAEGALVGAEVHSRQGVSFETLVGLIGRLSHLKLPGQKAG